MRKRKKEVAGKNLYTIRQDMIEKVFGGKDTIIQDCQKGIRINMIIIIIQYSYSLDGMKK